MDDAINSPLLEEVASALQNAVHAAGESLKDAAPDWASLKEDAKNRLKAGLLVLLSEHASNVMDLISALSHDVQAHVRGEPDGPQDEPPADPNADDA